MFAQFLTMYDIHRWLRYISWAGLSGFVLLFLYSDGGFPPHVWLLLLQVVFTSSAHNSTSPFFQPGLLAWSLIWAALWVSLGWICYVLIQHHRRSLALMTTDSHAHELWTPSPPFAPHQPVALAMSSSISVTGSIPPADALVSTLPRLRLPQRSSDSQVTQPLTGPHALNGPPAIPTGQPNVTVQLPQSSSPRVQPLQIGIGWHSGLVRRMRPNEDSVAAFQGSCTYHGELLPFGLFVVADGMGGHDCGLEASRIAMQSMTHTVLQNIIMGRELSHEFFMDMLIGGAEWANMAICQQAQKAGLEMGTTLTAALVINQHAYIINVGDSRTYLFRDSAGLLQVTRDHSLVASLVAFGQITPDEIYTHPERNKVYRSLGHQEELKVDTFMLDLQRYDCLLLCSDGLWEMVRDPTIERIIRSSNDPTLICDRLVQTALRSGGDDNISAVLVQVT